MCLDAVLALRAGFVAALPSTAIPTPGAKLESDMEAYCLHYAGDNMAKKGSGPGDEMPTLPPSTKFPVLSKASSGRLMTPWTPPSNGTLQAEDNVLDEIFGRLDGLLNPTTRHAAAKPRHRGRGRHT